jgi:hypothetical protein
MKRLSLQLALGPAIVATVLITAAWWQGRWCSVYVRLSCMIITKNQRLCHKRTFC